MSKRQLVASLFDTIGATKLMLFLRRRVPFPWMPVLTFHRVEAEPKSTLFDEGVIDATPSQFDGYLATIKRHFTTIGIEDLLRYEDGEPLPSNPLLMTFDDGYRDNYETALPILQRHGMKAVFFIATSYVTERRMFWWDRISYLVKQTTRPLFELSYPDRVLFDARCPAARRRTIRALLHLVKSRSALDLPRFLDELVRVTDVVWNDQVDRAFANDHLMTWDQVRGLRAAGMDVQSHTRTHRVLQTLDDAQILDELRGSREDLERELGESVRAISYPVGHSIGDRAYIRSALQQAGYRIGFTNGTGTHSLWRKFDRYDVNRISVDQGTPEILFRAMLAAPTIFD